MSTREARSVGVTRVRTESHGVCFYVCSMPCGVLCSTVVVSAIIRLLYPCFLLTTPKEIKEVVKSLRSKMAPGLDQVTPQMLKEIPKKGIVLLTYILME
jgi:hypothetical protein